MSALKKVSMAVFSACLLLIAITSGYWTRRPHSYSSCDLLAAVIPTHGANPVGYRQLAHDAEFAEDLGIRYADVCCGLRSGHFESMEEYARKRDVCIAQLFHVVAQNDGAPDEAVRRSLNHRPIELDISIILSFVLVYSWAVTAIAFQIWRAHGDDYGSQRAKVISVYAALLVGFAFITAGEIWFDTMEAIRIGNGHAGYRAERCPWVHHYYFEYITGATIFCAAILLQRRAAWLDGCSDARKNSG